ncbi:MAG: hypothetical protein JXO22_01285 [Phycisphaerae bacterium]|nr:hypothetical protein [Phycisphaerae bacterium]
MPDALLIHHKNLRTPPDDMGVLVEPHARHVLAALEEDHARRLCDVPLLGTTVGSLRQMLRAELGLDGPVVMTGHQPEFVHAGVLAKTIANHSLARRVGGQWMFLIADSDVPRESSVGVPQVVDGVVTRTDVPLPGIDLRLPAESQPAASRAAWKDCFATIAALLADSDETLLTAFTAAWLAEGVDELDYCEAMRRAHGAVESNLGLGGGRVLRMSELARTPVFQAFAVHLMSNAAEFAACYNAALDMVRTRRGIRNPRRPIPPLLIEAERVELPFWLQRRGVPRGRLFVSRERDALVLYSDQQRVMTIGRPTFESLASDVGRLSLEENGWQLRPRALMLSSFVRLFMADLFIHGIGGAKYDEVTDEFVRGFFGVEAPPMCVVSATLRLPLPSSGTTRAMFHAAVRAVRDVRFNPQRYVGGVPKQMLAARAALIERSADLRRTRPSEHGERRRVFGSIRTLNAELLRIDPKRPSVLAEEARRLESLLARDGLAGGREYFCAMHSHTRLMALTEKLRVALRP